MDDEISRASIGSTASRFTDDLLRNEHTPLETQLRDARNELYSMRRLMTFLENTDPENPSITFRRIASECADLQDERDKLRKEIEELTSSKQTELQRTEELISQLQRELEESREECSVYKRRCEQYEREQSDEESRFYRQELNSRPQLISSQPQRPEASNVQPEIGNSFENRQAQTRRVNFQIDQHAANDSNIRNLFNKMDENDSEYSSIASHDNLRNTRQEMSINYEANFTVTDPPNKSSDFVNLTGVAAANVNEYVNILKDYRSNIRALYDQMKSTAHFFVDILKRLGYENDPQIQLMMDKINQLNLNMQDSKTLSKKVLEETKQLGHELVGLYRSFDRAGMSPNASKNSIHEKHRFSPDREEFETVLREKDDLIVQFRNEKNELDNECQKLQADCNDLQHLSNELEQRIELCKEKESELLEELENRKKIIEALAQQIRQEVHEKNVQISELKQKVKVVLNNSKVVTNKLAVKIHEGATKSGYILSDEFGYN